jgi:signal transduction histidine kinase
MSEQERSRFLFMLKGDLQRLERLMNKLLDLARADTARPGDDQIDVVPALSDIVERFRERGLKIEHTCSEGAILAPISEEALGAIIGNLLENSVQHGGPDVTVSLVVRRIRSDEAPLVRIELGDNGPGAPEKHRDNIFERFFTTNREAGGTGLGLSIVKTIVEAHGGDIELAPSVKGALFIITLPSARRAHGQ